MTMSRWSGRAEASAELCIVFDYEGYADPGGMTGRMEDCYPPEDGETRRIKEMYWMLRGEPYQVEPDSDLWHELISEIVEQAVLETEIEESLAADVEVMG